MGVCSSWVGRCHSTFDNCPNLHRVERSTAYDCLDKICKMKDQLWTSKSKQIYHVSSRIGDGRVKGQVLGTNGETPQISMDSTEDGRDIEDHTKREKQ